MPKNSNNKTDELEVLAALAKPFLPSQVRWRVPENTIGTRLRDKRRFGRALAYLDARAVIDRLNEVLGGNWSSSLTPVTEYGQVTGFLCALTLTFPGGACATRTDIGTVDPNIGNDMALKAGASDALKRAAVLFGIGQYLSSLEMPQVEVDSSGRIIGPYPELPTLPATPPAMRGVRGATRPASKETSRREASTRNSRSAQIRFVDADIDTD